MYQHFNTTEGSKVVAQWTVCEPTSVPKKLLKKCKKIWYNIGP